MDRTLQTGGLYWNVDSIQSSHGDPNRRTLVGTPCCQITARQALAVRWRIDASGRGNRYADDKRSDIRVSYSQGGFNVPQSKSRRAATVTCGAQSKTQLIAKYTRDPGADGYGIYLVFWFGDAEGCRPTPRSGPKPKSAAELEKSLLETLSDHERRKISVCVIDVSKPVA